MSYFSNFPSTGYVLDETKAKIIKCKNILLRAKFSDYVKTNNALLVDYTIREGDRPDTVSYEAYGRADLHWIILLFNEIINPYHQWPLTQTDLEAFNSIKYRGIALYVRDGTVNYLGKTISNNTPFFENGDKIIQNNGASGTIMSYDSTMGKLIIEIDENTQEFETTKTVNGVVSLGVEIKIINKNGQEITGIVTKKEDNLYSVHHFEDSNGNWLDPRCKYPPALGATVGVSYRPYPNIVKSLINLYADPTVNDNGEPGTEGLEVAQKVVTNIDYEYKMNEEKRKIKILRPAFLDDVLKQFGDLFRNR